MNGANGAVVAGHTVSGIVPSSDDVPYSAEGKLYGSTLTVDASEGFVMPFIVLLFDPRAENGDSYRALADVAAPDGVSPTPLVEGERSSGKIYFDVTGAVPDSVVYRRVGEDPSK